MVGQRCVLLICLALSVFIVQAAKLDLNLQDDRHCKDMFCHTFINSWAVKIRGGPLAADIVAARNGFSNLGLVCI